MGINNIKEEFSMKKWMIILIIIFMISSLNNIYFAGQLGQNEYGFYYIQDDGTLAKSKWITMDLDTDGKEEYYYFNEIGLMAINTKTPDGYDVNEKGQWVKNGKVQFKNNTTAKNNSVASLGGVYKDTIDAYNKGLDAGQKAVEAGMDAGQKAVEAGIDAVGNMYGGIFKGVADEYKKEYGKAVDEYKKEYSKALDEYKDELNSAMDDYANQLGSLFSGFGF